MPEIKQADREAAKVRSRLQRTLDAMKARCRNPRHSRYEVYGGSGIDVCADWDSISSFFQWATSNGYRIGLQIDRIDPTRGYEPNNCRWVTMKQQNANRRMPIGKSGFRGVHPKRGRWQATIANVNNKQRVQRSLGVYPTKLQAAFAFDDAAYLLHGEYAVLNFPERIRAQKAKLAALVAAFGIGAGGKQ